MTKDIFVLAVIGRTQQSKSVIIYGSFHVKSPKKIPNPLRF